MQRPDCRFAKNIFRTLLVIVAGVLLAACTMIEASEEKQQTPLSVQDRTHETITVDGDTAYIRTCRANGVPIPPDWNVSSTNWKPHGNLGTILLTPNNMEKVQPDQTTFATVWSYASPTLRGACIALGRSSGSFQVICQGAASGQACFWGNDPRSPSSTWSPEISEVTMSSLLDPEQGFAAETVPCTECHRGSNAFLVAPDDATWATVLRPAQARPTFTTLVEQSVQATQSATAEKTTSAPRFTPIGGKSMALHNPPPTIPGCSGMCHEAHYPILEKGHTVEGYVRIPRPMGPNCARTSPADHPTKDCYHY